MHSQSSLPIPMTMRDDRMVIDLDWLEQQPAHHATAAVRHVRFGDPLRILLNGRKGTGTVLRPRADEPLPD